ncbi:Mucin-5AC [Liparis tanakae]|uniref:Mucin-5AC n=1 Tax=Liparis tanakae TaxID=230148 RepID=A0A4Z2EB00_9TELE|nr:Mucin-5AC [Liparis tanakae]
MATPFDISVEAKMGIKLVWNQDDSMEIEIDKKYQNQTCGLCGNFDGVDNDFMKNGELLFLCTHRTLSLSLSVYSLILAMYNWREGIVMLSQKCIVSLRKSEESKWILRSFVYTDQ